MSEDERLSSPEREPEAAPERRRRRRRRGPRPRDDGAAATLDAEPAPQERRRGERRHGWHDDAPERADEERKHREREKQKNQHPKPVHEPKAGTRFSASEIHDNVASAADEELHRPASELTWSALEAGLAIGFSALAAAFLSSLVPEKYATAATAAGYPLGFIFVVMARSQLFTENTLEPVVPFLDRRDRRTFRAMMRLWGIIWVMNMVGALLFALVTAKTEMFDASLRAALDRVAEEGTRGGFLLVAYKGIFAGWLVALMAWLIGSTRSATGQIILVWLTTAPIAAFGLKHSIAGSVEAFYRVLRGAAGWWEMVGGFVIPATLGNIVGGVLLVALLNHGKAGNGNG